MTRKRSRTVTCLVCRGKFREAANLRERLAAAGCDPLPRSAHQVLPLVKVREEDRVDVWNEACRRVDKPEEEPEPEAPPSP